MNKGFSGIGLIIIAAIAAAGLGYYVISQNESGDGEPTKGIGGAGVSGPPAEVRVEIGKDGLKEYADLPLSLIPKTPITVKFLVEHRSALNKKEVTVKGFVVETLLGKKACPTTLDPRSLAPCAQPRIILSDTSSQNRDQFYNLTVLAKDTDKEKDYLLGKMVEIKGTVESGEGAVILIKS